MTHAVLQVVEIESRALERGLGDELDEPGSLCAVVLIYDEDEGSVRVLPFDVPDGSLERDDFL